MTVRIPTLVACFAFIVGCGGTTLHAGDPEAHVESEHDEAEGEHDEHGDEVKLEGTALANARLRVEAVNREVLHAEVLIPARIALDPLREAGVAAVSGGTLERVRVRPGDKVGAGANLGTVLSPDLGSAVGAHLGATARLDAAGARKERLASLAGSGFSSAAEVSQADADLTIAAADAEAAEERLRVFGVTPETIRPRAGQHFTSRFAITSPIGGEVLAVDARVGASVAPGAMLFHVADLDEVWLILEVYERDLALVELDAPVSFTTTAYGEEVFTGKVDQISAWLDPVSRTTEVRVVVANPGHRLKPNMFAKARLAVSDEGAQEGIALPAAAVQEVEGRPSVFLEETVGTYAVRAVEVEPMADGRLRVVAGLAAGDRVVVDGAFTLKSELAKGELGEGHAH